MAYNKTRLRQSLAVLPLDYVIMAKRISQGGELILVKKPSHPEIPCEHDMRKGRVCIQGPLGEMIKIKGVKITQNAEDCITIQSHQTTSSGAQVRRHSTLFPYRQYKLDVKSLNLQLSVTETKEGPPSTMLTKPLDIPELSLDSHPAMPAYKTIMENISGEDKQMTDEKSNDENDRIKIVIETSDVSKESNGMKTRSLHEKGGFENVTPAPLHNISKYSVLVKWKHHPNVPCYTMRSVFDVLSKYGKIVAMGQLSINSCLLLFEDFHSSVLVVRNSLIGPKAYPLICMWYYPSMHLDSIDLLDIHPYKKPKIVSAEAKWLHQYHEMQEQVISCFKTRAHSLSYDRSAFNP